MKIDDIIVLIVSTIGIVGTYWFFLMKKDKDVSVKNQGTILEHQHEHH